MANIMENSFEQIMHLRRFVTTKITSLDISITFI